MNETDQSQQVNTSNPIKSDPPSNTPMTLRKKMQELVNQKVPPELLPEELAGDGLKRARLLEEKLGRRPTIRELVDLDN